MKMGNFLKGSQRLIDDLEKGNVILSTKGKYERANGMTIGWGFFGIMWNEEYFIAAVRPNRFTWRLIHDSKRFTLNFLDERYREAIDYFGTTSGYDEDKFAKGLLTLETLEGFTAPIKEAHTVVECKVVFANNIEPFGLPQDYIDNFYTDNAFHTMLYGKIENILKR